MKIKWLNKQPKEQKGVSWGVPWPKGTLAREESLSLKDSSNKHIPVQSWPMAFWPDGSVKWTGHAAVMAGDSDTYELSSGKENAINQSSSFVNETDDVIEVDTGKLIFTINKKGNCIIESVKREGKTVAEAGRLIARKEERTHEQGIKTIKEITLQSTIKQVEIEQSGQVRTVIKVDGIHQSLFGNETLLPFVIRFYFYRNTTSIRAVYTLFYDGQPEEDYIKGVGLEFAVPLAGEAFNRHVRFVGDEGIYSEPAQLLLTRRHRNAEGLYDKQIKGEVVNLTEEDHGPLLEHATQNAIWNDFKMTQDSADHYRIVKRTGEEHSWIESTHGTRAKGLIYVGGRDNGVAVGVKDFWQKQPSSLEVNDLSNSIAKLTVWLWSPDAEAMDFRHYNKDTHVISAYEGFDEMRATPYGISNTSEVMFHFFANSPSNEELMERTSELQSPLLLVCEPEYYYNTKALGIWSLPDRSTPIKAMLEEQLDEAFHFYKNEIEQRRWYGFWHYGDVMHTYDPVRHQWRYDLGGFAWQNTELVPNIWLWYSFLRSGREDVFIMAEAMTRHTSEVDCYHFGEYKGLGSRHNVVHWGCGCKEARISMAGLHKYYYFLTTDERTRDLLSEVRDADQAIATLDPMREFYPNDQYETHARVGPDWAAFCSNWFSEWERTENLAYKEKIISGIETLKKLPLRLLSGPTFGYDPDTSTLLHMGEDGVGAYHMVIAFGGPQAWMDIAGSIEDPEWEEMLAEFGEFYVLTNEEKIKRSNGVLHDKQFSLPMLAAGMVAYAAAKKKDSRLARKAWELLLNEEISEMVLPIKSQKLHAWRELEEIPSITTNTTSQWCLNTIVSLELIGESLLDKEFQESVTLTRKCLNE
ncbi:hypothetical protein [Bacillus suaedae]|nr:hypothetical protein [Bacillus suaedae]